jgi:hypothetical protein
MPLRRCGHVFGTVVDHFHWSPRLPGEQGRVSRDDRGILLLAAEAAAGLHLNNSNLLCWHLEERQERLLDVIRALHRAPDGDAIDRIGDGEHAVRLDVELLLGARLVLAFDHTNTIRHRGIDIAT